MTKGITELEVEHYRRMVGPYKQVCKNLTAFFKYEGMEGFGDFGVPSWEFISVQNNTFTLEILGHELYVSVLPVDDDGLLAIVRIFYDIDFKKHCVATLGVDHNGHIGNEEKSLSIRTFSPGFSELQSMYYLFVRILTLKTSKLLEEVL